MSKRLRKLINKYYNHKISKYSGTWRAEYYKYLKEYAMGKNYKKVVKPRFKKKLAEHVKEAGKGKWYRRYLEFKLRLQMILFGLRDDEFFSMGYYKKPLFFSRKAMTKARIYWMDRYLNDYTYIRYIGNKATFAELIGQELFGRKWLLGPASFEAFSETFSSCDKVMVKPLVLFGGKGIKLYNITEDKEATYKEICETYEEGYIIEEYFYQKGFLHELNESSLNTIRVITIRRPGTQEVFVLDSFLRVGMPGEVIDNYSSGGATYDLDIKTGTIGTVGAKSIKNSGMPNNHPGTDRCFTGLVIPYWDEILETCKDTHKLIPEGLNFIGWDVCLSDDKITFVEANALAGFGRQYKGKRDRKWTIIEGVLDTAQGHQK